jgi:hypothetical protein
MLYAFGFERVGVMVGDLYFVDPRPNKGQEGAEHGVRVELRVLQRGALKGSVYSAQPIEVGRRRLALGRPDRRVPGRPGFRVPARPWEAETWPVTRRDG